MRTLIGLLFLLFTTPLVAGECGAVRRVVVTHYPVVVKDYYERIRVIPIEVHRDHYYSFNPLLAELQETNRLLRLQLDGKTAPIRGGTVQSPEKEKSVPPGTYQDEKLLAVVNKSCVKCHGAESKHTKFVTKDGKLSDLPAGKVWEAFALVNTGEMPSTGEKLTDDEVKMFYDWGKKARK